MKTIRVASGFIRAILRQSAAVPKVDPTRSRCVSVLVLLTLMFAVGIPSAEGQDTEKNALVAVKTTQPEKITLKFATSQPATVHAYFEAELYAKV